MNRINTIKMNPFIPYDPSIQVVLGIPFNNVTFAEAVEWVHHRIISRTPGYIATANLDFVKQAWEDPELQRILLEADLVVADGFPIVWLSRLFGPALKERVTGSDLVPMLAKMAADRGHSLFLLGGAPGVGEKAADSLRNRFPGVRIAGQYSPPLSDVLTMDHSGILLRLEAANPDILLIAFGAPKQEKFANFNVRKWSIPVSIGVGGTLDFLAGTQTRAPKIVQRLSLEWFWRMMTAPQRLAKRYWADLVFLLATCWRLLILRLTPDRPSRSNGGDNTGGTCAEAIHWSSYTLANDRGLPPLFLSAATNSIALDLRNLPWLSSTDLGILLQLAKACRSQGHRLVLYNAGSRVTRLLSTCRLVNYIDLVEDKTQVDVLLSKLTLGGWAIQGDNNQLIIETPRELTQANVQDFRELIDPEFKRAAPYSAWVVDLQHTVFLTTAGLGLIRDWMNLAAKRKIPMKIRNARGNVTQTFIFANASSWLDPNDITNLR